MISDFHIIQQKAMNVLSAPETGITVATTTGLIGAINTFMKELPIIHDGVSLIAMLLGCMLSIMIIRINIVRLRIKQIELKEKQIRLLRIELGQDVDPRDVYEDHSD